MSNINRVESIVFKCKECDFFERETCYTGHSIRQKAREHAENTGHEIDSYCCFALHPYHSFMRKIKEEIHNGRQTLNSRKDTP